MLSATENPVVVEEYLKRKCELGTVVGPLATGSIPVHIDRLSVIQCYSVNDGIEQKFYLKVTIISGYKFKRYLQFIDLVDINFSGFTISSSDTYHILFRLSTVSSDEPFQKANL